MTDAATGDKTPTTPASSPTGQPAAPVTPAAGAAPAAGATPSPAAAAPASAAPAPATTTTTESKPADPAGTKPSLLEATGTEVKPSEGKEPTPDKPESEPSKDAPPTTAYEFKLPDDIKITDEKQFGEFKNLLAKSKVPAESAPELVKWMSVEKDKLVTELSGNQRKVWDETNAQWANEFRADPKIGGEKAEATLSQISSLMNEFGKDIPTLRSTLTLTGAGNHPDVIRFLHRVSEALKEGGMISAGKGANVKPQSRAQRMYNNNPS